MAPFGSLSNVFTMQRSPKVILSAALTIAFAATASAQSLDQAGTAASAHHPTRGRVTDHVVIISIDGLRPDAIEKFKPATILRLMKEGRYSLSASTIPLSFTLPSHTSMLTGVTPEKHGVTWNTDRAEDLGFTRMPTVFQYAKIAGYTTAAFFSKSKFSALMAPGTLDYAVRQDDEQNAPWTADRALSFLHAYLESKPDPNVLFIHIADVDMAGHAAGWMSRQYAEAVEQADMGVEMALSDITQRFGEGNFTLILTGDHGGHDRTHGTTSRIDMTIPWITWGQGVNHSSDQLKDIKTMDTAATAMWLLGIALPAVLDGHPVTAAFDSTVAKP